MFKTLRKIWKTAIVESNKHKKFTYVRNFVRTLHEKKESTDKSNIQSKLTPP